MLPKISAVVRNPSTLAAWCVALAILAAWTAGCNKPTTDGTKPAAQATPPAGGSVAAVKPATPAPPATPAGDTRKVIRIKAGGGPITDSKGNTWAEDTGFADGQTIDRTGLAIAGTDIQTVYQSERYAMTAFSYPVPNGKYTVKLHFAETYDGITGAGMRVFGVKVAGAPANTEMKEFDPYKESGSFAKAIVKSYDVDVTNGKIEVTFTFGVENPEINGIEILPR